HLNSVNGLGTCGSCAANQYISSNNTCTTCTQGCATCTDANTCQSCSSGFFLNGTSCVSTCSDGQYEDASSGQCKPCDSSCATCTGAGTNACVNCADSNYFNWNGTCYATCPPGTIFANNVGVQKLCMPGCALGSYGPICTGCTCGHGTCDQGL